MSLKTSKRPYISGNFSNIFAVLFLISHVTYINGLFNHLSKYLFHSQHLFETSRELLISTHSIFSQPGIKLNIGILDYGCFFKLFLIIMLWDKKINPLKYDIVNDNQILSNNYSTQLIVKQYPRNYLYNLLLLISNSLRIVCQSKPILVIITYLKKNKIRFNHK